MGEAARLSVVVETRGIAQTKAQLAGVQGGLLGATKSALKFTAAYAGIGAVGAAVVGTIKSTADLEKNLSALKATTHATAKQMAAFKSQDMHTALTRLGFSASQAAQAQTELAKGGLTAAQILGGGMKAALSLAAAGQMQLSDAANTTANAMNLFGLSGRQASHVADALSTAANATTADVSDFAMALTQGGAAAKTAGLSFNQTVVALELLAKSGVKNSDAGTSLKTAMVHLANPSKKAATEMKQLGLEFFTAGGNIKNVAAISDMLRNKMGGLTRQQRLQALATIAGTDGLRVLSAMYDQGGKQADKFAKGLEKHGSAMQQAKTQQDNLSGSLTQLKNTVQAAAIDLGDKIAPALRSAAEAGSKFVRQMISGKGAGGEFVDKVKAVGGAVLDVAKPIAQAALAVGKFFASHTGLLKGALVVWASYKAAAATATAATKVRLLSQFVGLVPKARAAGLASGVAFNNGLTIAGAEGAAAGGAAFGAKFAAGAALAMRAFGWAALGAYMIDATGVGKWLTKQSWFTKPANWAATAAHDTASSATNAVSIKREQVDTTGAVASIKRLADAYGAAKKPIESLQVANGRFGSTADAAGKKAIGQGKAMATAGGQAKDASGNVSGLKSAIGGLKSKSVKVGVTGPESAIPMLGTVRDLIASIQSKTVTVAVRFAVGKIPVLGNLVPKHRSVGGINPTPDEAFLAGQQAIIDQAAARQARLQEKWDRRDYGVEHAKAVILAGRRPHKVGKKISLKGLTGAARTKAEGHNQKVQDAKDRNASIIQSLHALDDLEMAHRRTGQSAALDKKIAAAQKRIDAKQKQMGLPTAADSSLAYMAGSRVAGNLEGVRAGAEQLQRDRFIEYVKALATNDPRKIAEAADNLSSASQQLKDAGQAIKDAAESAKDTTATGNNAALVMAQVDTPLSTVDDLAALQQALADDTKFYNDAKAAKDNEGIIKWGGAITALLDQIKGLTEAGNADTVAKLQEQVDLWKAAAQDARRDANAANAQFPALLGWFTDQVGNRMGQQILLGSTTPAAGAAGSL